MRKRDQRRDQRRRYSRMWSCILVDSSIDGVELCRVVKREVVVVVEKKKKLLQLQFWFFRDRQTGSTFSFQDRSPSHRYM